MQPINNNAQSSNLTLAESLNRLKTALAEVVCHPDLSKAQRDFLVSFCKVVADQVAKDGEGNNDLSD